MVLMNEIVAVEHTGELLELYSDCDDRRDLLYPIPRRIPSDYSHNLTRSDPYNIFHSCCFVWQHLAAAACPREDLEVDKVDMNRM
jgi:hypothetical protein